MCTETRIQSETRKKEKAGAIIGRGEEIGIVVTEVVVDCVVLIHTGKAEDRYDKSIKVHGEPSVP